MAVQEFGATITWQSGDPVRVVTDPAWERLRGARAQALDHLAFRAFAGVEMPCPACDEARRQRIAQTPWFQRFIDWCAETTHAGDDWSPRTCAGSPCLPGLWGRTGLGKQ